MKESSHLSSMAVVAIVAMVAVAVLFLNTSSNVSQEISDKEFALEEGELVMDELLDEWDDESDTPTGQVVLQQNGARCRSGNECQSHICGLASWSSMILECTPRAGKVNGAACRWLQNVTDSGDDNGVLGNDYECSSGLCGLNSTDPFTMACKKVGGGDPGSVCSRGSECDTGACRIENEGLIGFCV